MFLYTFIARTDTFDTLVHFTSYLTLMYVIFFFTFQVIEYGFQVLFKTKLLMSFIIQKSPKTFVCHFLLLTALEFPKCPREEKNKREGSEGETESWQDTCERRDRLVCAIEMNRLEKLEGGGHTQREGEGKSNIQSLCSTECWCVHKRYTHTYIRLP